ncbi:MAG: SDR family NAD(P)-dependent oxidoreductase [Dehalococcoidales bacterium]|nr:SDR family NAD(P)-dependent oxidoreductase [Dehalococcoidales bacterium]
MDFKGKVAVITGGASGIGRSVALALAKLGTDIVVADLDDTRLGEVRKEIEGMGRRALAVHCDVLKDADIDNLAEETFKTMSKVDILFNNAGVSIRGRMENISMKDWEWIVGINLFGVVRGIHAFLPHMLERGSGYIINTASGNGLVGSEPPAVASEGIPYTASKFGVVGLSEGLFGYLRPQGIMVSVLCPALVRTSIATNARYIMSDSEKKAKLQDAEKLFTKNMGKAADALDVMESDDAAQLVIKSMEEKRFFIITHESQYEHLMRRGQDYRKLEKYLQDAFGK